MKRTASQELFSSPVWLAFLAAALGACNDGSSSHTVAFDPFVTNLIQSGTTETDEPVEVEGTRFAFPENDDAFDDVLPPDDGPVVEQ